MVGWRGKRVNTLRLWTAQRASTRSGSMRSMPATISGALTGQVRADSLVRVLYPADSTPAGQELRLRQEYFFTAASIQDIIRRHMQQIGDIRALPDKAAIQLNDTHPAIAVAELMRMLIDAMGSNLVKPGTSLDGPSPTPITRCCPRRLKAGRFHCSSGCCRGTCRSSTPSTRGSSPMRAKRRSTMTRSRPSR